MTRASGAALVVGCVLAAAASVAAAATPPYDLAATQACLLALPHSVDGLPPARPPAPPALFVEALSHDAVSTWADVGPNARPHRQLGVWTGIRRYEGVVLTFFRSAADAHVSADARTRNVVWTSDQRRPTSVSLRRTVERCLRPKSASRPHGQPPPPAASLATFAGSWGGHTRGLSITPRGSGTESADDGCCTRVYAMTFEIVSIRGTLTRATALIRVTSFRRWSSDVRALHPGELGRLTLRDGIVTSSLTGEVFCSDPAWGATGACGA